jgi:hypothetical protein
MRLDVAALGSNDDRIQQLIRELCGAFGQLVRHHAEKPSFEVVFSDYEACQRARLVFEQVSAESGIVAYTRSERSQARASQLHQPPSESEVVEFSSDCLPITTTSSSSLLELVDDKGDTYPQNGALLGSHVDGGPPLSPLTEVPPTPTLSNTHELSESEGEEHDRRHSSRQSRSGVLPINSSKIHEARLEKVQQRREVDPVRAIAVGSFIMH